MTGNRTTRQTRRDLRSTTNSRVYKPQALPKATKSRRLRHTTIEHEEQQRTLKANGKTLVPAYLQLSEADAALDPNQNIWLFAFPRELIQEISSHLPIESIVCLTLTCKLALHIVGTSSWEDERITKRWCTDLTTRLVPRSVFMELLGHDVKGLGFESCKACNTLHPPLKRPSEHRQNKLTKYCWGQDAIVDYLPQDENGLGYLYSTPSDSDSPIEYLSGSFKVPHPCLNYTVSSSARRVSGNLIIRHDYRFSHSSPRSPLRVSVAGICSHQTTSTDPPAHNRYISSSNPNGPLLTHSIVSAFPMSQRTDIPKAGVFRQPTSLERQQMTSADNGLDVIFKCRYCPTEWRTSIVGGKGTGRGELTVSVFHSFSKELHSAAKSWRWFVRREGELLGKGKRNSEFWSVGKTYPDFRVE
ncbi:hypothetical protein F4804DRAFT_343970 [Jackrogersella minutella]|nr:hypothetical protein F4804DRAFT_343970 [Jackrogersella minutella]